LQVMGGIVGAIRTRMVIEEHGSGKQMVRFRFWPWCPLFGVVIAALFMVLCAAAAFDHAPTAAVVLGCVAAFAAGRILFECAVATYAVTKTLEDKRMELAVLLQRLSVMTDEGNEEYASASANGNFDSPWKTVWENKEAS